MLKKRCDTRWRLEKFWMRPQTHSWHCRQTLLQRSLPLFSARPSLTIRYTDTLQLLSPSYPSIQEIYQLILLQKI